MSVKKIVAAVCLAATTAASVHGADNEFSFKPELYATLRPRYEVATSSGDMRFQIRNARVGLQGYVCPIVDFRVEIDCCERGSIKFLDVWGRVKLGNHLKVQLGNMRMPFTFGSAVAPHNYLFADRPFTDKQVVSPRNIGCKLMVTAGKLSVEGGGFNSFSTTTAQTKWENRMSGAVKATVSLGNVKLQTGAETLCPDSIRMNNASFGTNWRSGRWTAEAEYVYRHYNLTRMSNTHVWNVMADYAMPLRWEYAQRLSFQGRYDGMTNCSGGSGQVTDGCLPVTYAACNRFTAGATLSYLHEKVKVDFKLNYIHHRYHHDAPASLREPNRIVAELMVHF